MENRHFDISTNGFMRRVLETLKIQTSVYIWKHGKATKLIVSYTNMLVLDLTSFYLRFALFF